MKTLTIIALSALVLWGCSSFYTPGSYGNEDVFQPVYVPGDEDLKPYDLGLIVEMDNHFASAGLIFINSPMDFHQLQLAVPVTLNKTINEYSNLAFSLTPNGFAGIAAYGLNDVDPYSLGEQFSRQDMLFFLGIGGQADLHYTIPTANEDWLTLGALYAMSWEAQGPYSEYRDDLEGQNSDDSSFKNYNLGETGLSSNGQLYIEYRFAANEKHNIFIRGILGSAVPDRLLPLIITDEGEFIPLSYMGTAFGTINDARCIYVQARFDFLTGGFNLGAGLGI